VIALAEARQSFHLELELKGQSRRTDEVDSSHPTQAEAGGEIEVSTF
jgi:hypothetical protein